jgi:hypothetical protein
MDVVGPVPSFRIEWMDIQPRLELDAEARNDFVAWLLTLLAELCIPYDLNDAGMIRVTGYRRPSMKSDGIGHQGFS